MSLTAIAIAASGFIVALLAALFKGRVDGAKAERAKVNAERIEARDIADQVQNDVGAMPPDAARKELREWK